MTYFNFLLYLHLSKIDYYWSGLFKLFIKYAIFRLSAQQSEFSFFVLILSWSNYIWAISYGPKLYPKIISLNRTCRHVICILSQKTQESLFIYNISHMICIRLINICRIIPNLNLVQQSSSHVKVLPYSLNMYNTKKQPTGNDYTEVLGLRQV